MQKVCLTYLNSQYLHTQEKGYIVPIAAGPVGGWLHADACTPRTTTPRPPCTCAHLHPWLLLLPPAPAVVLAMVAASTRGNAL